ncbi:MAG TPA: hypothetical protein VFT55_05935 [Planctomycetota bacterium]|nr:hypothetical protein [Planctomycetota bacterium]
MKILPLLLFLLPGSCAAPAAPIAPVSAPVRLLVDESETAFHDANVLAIDDANAQFNVMLATKSPIDTARAHTIVLVLADLRLAGSSFGSHDGGSSVVFRATSEQARAVASGLGIPAQEREAWRGVLTGQLEPVGEPTAGAEHLPMRFLLTNTGPVALWFLDGGRGRNELGRDNRFSFEIEREGERLPTRELHDFGGMGVFRRLAPGQSWTLELDLAHWRVLERTSTYRLRAKYEAELMPADYEPGQDLPMGYYSHLNRTRTVAAELTLVLR